MSPTTGNLNAILVAACLLLLLALYVGGYALLVQPTLTVDYVLWGDGLAEHPDVIVAAEYPVGGEVARWIFAPVHAADRWVRYETWSASGDHLYSTSPPPPVG
jgi:hypothetical protein